MNVTCGGVVQYSDSFPRTHIYAEVDFDCRRQTQTTPKVLSLLTSMIIYAV